MKSCMMETCPVKSCMMETVPGVVGFSRGFSCRRVLDIEYSVTLTCCHDTSVSGHDLQKEREAQSSCCMILITN